MAFDFVDRSPPVAHLGFHLDRHQTVMSAEEQEQSALARGGCGTKLMENFKTNEEYPEARPI